MRQARSRSTLSMSAATRNSKSPFQTPATMGGAAQQAPPSCMQSVYRSIVKILSKTPPQPSTRCIPSHPALRVYNRSWPHHLSLGVSRTTSKLRHIIYRALFKMLIFYFHVLFILRRIDKNKATLAHTK